MQFKLIDDERLSIYLTHDELEKQKIDAEILKEPERLRELICKAGEESGFSVSDSALEVEIIPIIDGDLIVSIRRIKKETEKTVRLACFSDAESLIEACGQIKPLHSGTSDLYLYDGRYYLVLKSAFPNIGTDGVISEFGCDAEKINEAVLCEHGKLICEQKCVELFTKMFLKQ